MTSYEGLLFLSIAIVLIGGWYLERWLAHRHRIANGDETVWSARQSLIWQWATAALSIFVGLLWLNLSTPSGPPLTYLRPLMVAVSVLNAVVALVRGFRLLASRRSSTAP